MIAVERQGRTGATVWIRSEDVVRPLPEGVSTEISHPWPSPGRYGRNSNLRRLPEFGEAALLRCRVSSLIDGIELIASLKEG